MHKNKLKMASRSNIRQGTIKLNENTGKRLFDYIAANIFLVHSPKAKEITAKTDGTQSNLKAKAHVRGYKS